MGFPKIFSQTRYVRERKVRGLHPVSELNRFYILVCCFFCSVTVSLTYAFDMFTTDLTKQFGLSAGDLSTVSTVGLVFCYFTIQYGFIYEKCGPFLLFIICMVTGIVGSLTMALAFEGKVAGTTATFSVFYAFLNTCSGLIDVAYITTLSEIFPRNRGPVVSLAKVMTSLGSSLLACISTRLFPGNITGYIYFLMALVTVVSLWASFTVVLPPYYMNWWRRRGKTEEEIAELEATRPYYEHKCVPYRRLGYGYVVIVALIILFAVQAPVLAYKGDVSRGGEIAVAVVAILVTLSIFGMALPIRWLGGVDEPMPGLAALPATPESDREPISHPSDEDFHKEVVAGEADTDSSSDANSIAGPSRQDPRYPGHLFNYLCAPDIYLVFLMMAGSGVLGTLVSYNASTISVAIDGKERSSELSALYTAFLGVGSSVGRIAFGLFEAYVQSQDPINRKVVVTMAMPVSPIVATIAGILLLTLPGKVILFPYILVYFENGFTAAMNALIFPCLFEHNHNALYNLSFLVTCVCIICFNRLMFGMYVDKKHDEYGFPAGVDCNRKECVQVPLIVATCTAAASVVAGFLIHFRYRRFVRRTRAAQQAEENAAAGRVEVQALEDGLTR